MAMDVTMATGVVFCSLGAWPLAEKFGLDGKICRPTGRLAGWLAGWLADRPAACRLAGWQAGQLAGWLACWPAG